MTKCHAPVQQVLPAKICACAYKGTGFHFLLENSLHDDNLFLLNPFNSLFPLCVSVCVVQGRGTAEWLSRDAWLGSVPVGASSGAVRALVACN